MNTNVIDVMAKGSVEAFNLGVKVEQERIVKLIADLAVVNPMIAELITIIKKDN
jgi:ABC-type Fe3+-siderophore transport system permease subunit